MGNNQTIQGDTRFAGRSARLRPEPAVQSPPTVAAAIARPLAWRPGDRCPECGRAHWHVGRLSVECAFCATALPLAEAA
jgi:hypothetical protein